MEDVEGRRQSFKIIVDECSTNFCGWVVRSVYNVGRKGHLQMFYLTLLNYYFGLSRAGIVVNHRNGAGMSLTAFDDTRKMYIQRSTRNTKDKIKQACVLWVDNFSKFKAHNVPTIRKEVFSECLWSGITVNEYTGPYVDPKLKYNDENILIHAMPDDIFVQKDAVHNGIMMLYDEGMMYFDTSLVNKYDVRNIPLKIDTTVYNELATIMNSVKNTTKHIHPYKLLRPNIGSNRGLLKILRDLILEFNLNTAHATPDNYLVINVDENIYYRILKVFIYTQDML